MSETRPSVHARSGLRRAEPQHPAAHPQSASLSIRAGGTVRGAILPGYMNRAGAGLNRGEGRFNVTLPGPERGDLGDERGKRRRFGLRVLHPVYRGEKVVEIDETGAPILADADARPRSFDASAADALPAVDDLDVGSVPQHRLACFRHFRLMPHGSCGSARSCQAKHR